MKGYAVVGLVTNNTNSGRYRSLSGSAGVRKMFLVRVVGHKTNNGVETLKTFAVFPRLTNQALQLPD
jgi:hypothetical protein